MDLSFNEDQVTFAGVLSQMLADAGGFRPSPGWARWDYDTALDMLLEEAGFFGAAAEDSLGPVMAAEMIARVAALPGVVECAASALLRPFLGDLPRPLAVLDGDPGAVRFAPLARAVVRLGTRVEMALLDGAEPVGSPFAYPLGRLDPSALDWRPVPVDPARARSLWQVATAAELLGTLTGGLEAVLAHVRERRQFGRPLGSFQAMQHRLAQGAVSLDGARWLVLKAAQTGAPGDAALALGHLQQAAGPMVYDLHQFMGAMGLTLEHPLHRWTYRARLLRSALGGVQGNLAAYAESRWGEP